MRGDRPCVPFMRIVYEYQHCKKIASCYSDGLLTVEAKFDEECDYGRMR